AEVTNLAGPPQIAKCPGRLLERGLPVVPVQVEDVDVVGVEAFEAGLDRLVKPATRQPPAIGPLALGIACLGGDDEVVASASELTPGNLFRAPARVDVGRVDEVHPRLGSPIKD